MDVTSFVFLGIDGLTWLLMLVLVIVLSVTFLSSRKASIYESFADSPVDLSALTTQALDAPPSTSELKDHYKKLLIFTADDFKNNGSKLSYRILGDFRQRVYAKTSFRDNLKTSDVLANWPSWLPPLDPTITEPVPTQEDAVTAESKMLAYLARYFPQEPSNDESASIVRSLINDFGYRFVFKQGIEVSRVDPDFTPSRLLRNWVNPTR
jgi:hypothetical protein